MGQATLGVDRHHPHPLAGIGEPTVAAEGLEVVHSVRVTQDHTDGLREGGESSQ